MRSEVRRASVDRIRVLAYLNRETPVIDLLQRQILARRWPHGEGVNPHLMLHVAVVQPERVGEILQAVLVVKLRPLAYARFDEEPDEKEFRRACAALLAPGHGI